MEKIRRSAFESSSKKKSNQSLHLLLMQPWFVQAKKVALYASQSFEFSTQKLFELCIEQGKEIYFPVMSGTQLTFHRVKKQSQIAKGFSRVDQPLFGSIVEPDQIDVFFVPLVAFDRKGNRLGRGGGSYDRVFNNKLVTGVKVGLAFEFQKVDLVPFEAHDMKMDYILTEKEIRKSV